jgi:hypothetical protein
VGFGCGFLISGAGGGLTFCMKESCIAFARSFSGFRSTSGFLLSLIFYYPPPPVTCSGVNATTMPSFLALLASAIISQNWCSYFDSPHCSSHVSSLSRSV